MKPCLIKNCIIVITSMLVGSLVLSGVHLIPVVMADDAKKEPASLKEKLVGTWILVGKPGDAGEPTKAGGMLKFVTGKYWCITQADPKTGKVIYHHGGTYTLNGDKYVETVEYANESTISLLKQTLNFTVKIEGDTYTQIGIGNPYTQLWKRLK